ncbi:MAG: tetratricopeptide repeat protein, partial [Deltaproteobacteria bacterium]|nr:tetratricopeptide repeat protein [Deltaproteobacteria bacterium]
AQYEKALALNPNDADVLAHMGLPLSFAGRPEQAMEQIKRAKRLNPAYPPWYPWILGWAQAVAEQYEASIASSKEAAILYPTAEVHLNLAVAYHYLGRAAKARAAVQESLRIDPELNLDGVKAALPFADPADLERFLLAMREAGLPEHAALSLPNKPSIAVLPFTNMSDDAEQEYFADGMTEDLITDISKVSGLFVIARNSVFTYKGKAVKVKQVAEELGVRYVMEGSVRRVGNQVRINVQLIDATSGGHVWAERYDGSLDNVFAMQDKVMKKIVAALAVTLTDEETVRFVDEKPSSPEAYDAFLRGWANYQLHNPDDFAKAIPHFETAVDLEPGYSNAHAALAAIYWESWNNGWVQSLETTFFHALKQAKKHLQEAMKNPTPIAHWVASNFLLSQGEYEQAVREAEWAITLEPNNATGHAALANALLLAGYGAKGVGSIQTAMRLDPLHPGYLITLGQAQFSLESFKDAAITLERAVKRNPENVWAWISLAATYGHLDRAVDGQAAIESYNELRIQQGLPELIPGQLDYWGFGQGTYRDRVLAGLTKVPEPKWRALITGNREAGYEIKGVTTIDVDTAKILHERGVLFVKLRYYPQDWMAGHIRGAIWLEPGRVSRITLREIADKDQELVFYSTLGTPTSAVEASAKAITWGYKNVYHFPEGIVGWRTAGYPIEKGE